MENFVNYCKDYILDNIEGYEGQSVYGSEFGYTLTEGANCDGSLTYSREEAKHYLKEWWDEAAAYWEYEKLNFGEVTHNPFDNPEAYMVCMVIEGVNAILSEQEDISENWNDEFVLTKEISERIKEYVKNFDENTELF